MIKKICLLFIGLLFITPVLADENVQITNLSILTEREYIVLEENNQLQLELNVVPENADTSDLEWYSSDESIASVDENGLITAHTYGEVMIGIRNAYIEDFFNLSVISEPKKVLNTFVKKFSNISVYDYLSKKLANNSSFLNDYVAYYVVPTITDSRITYTYTYDRNGYTDSYGYSVYYNLTFSIEDVDGSIYSKTINNALSFKVADNIDEEDKIELPDLLVTSLSDTITIDIGENLNNIYENITDRDTLIFNVTDVSNKFKQRYLVDLLNGYKVGYRMVYYERKMVTIEGGNEYEVPYDVRDDELLQQHIRSNWPYAIRYLSYTYNQELTDEYEFDHDNMGIYDFTNGNGRVIPVIIYREELTLSDIEIVSPITKIPLDPNNYELELKVNRVPTNAVYEIVNWQSSNTSVLTVNSDGVVKPVGLGYAVIRACDETGLICDTIEIEVISKSENYLVDANRYLYLYNDDLLYFLVNKQLKPIASNVSKIFDDYYLTNENKLYYVTKSYSNGSITGVSEISFIASGVKDFYYNGLLTTNDELYEFSNRTVGDKVFDNVKDYYSGMILTINNELYVYNNYYLGTSINNGEYISTPILIARNVKEIGPSHYLTQDGKLYVVNGNLPEPILFDTDVSSIEYFKDNAEYIYKKDNTYVYGKYSILDGELNIHSKNTSNAKKIVVNTAYIQYYENRHDFIIIDENNQFCNRKICFENIKDVAVLDYADNSTIYYITRDNKLYYIPTKLYYDKSYLIASNVDSFLFDAIIKTESNDYFRMSNWDQFPYQLYRSSSPYIIASSVSFNENMKTDITVGESITMKGKIIPTNANNNDITWSVDNTSLANINNNGLLIAKKSGVVTVYATTGDNIVSEYKINIHSTANSVTIENKQKEYYLLSYYFGSNNFIDLSAIVGPSDVIDREVVWSTDDSTTDYIRFESQYTAGMESSPVRIYETGFVGDVTIYAKTKDGKYQDSIKIKIIRGYQNVDFNNIYLNLHYNDIYYLSPESFTPSDFDLSYITYESNDNNIYIDNNNYLHALNVGNYTIKTYIFGNEYKEINVYVTDEELFDTNLIALDCQTETVNPGDTLTCNLIINNNSSVKEIAALLKFSDDGLSPTFVPNFHYPYESYSMYPNQDRKYINFQYIFDEPLAPNDNSVIIGSFIFPIDQYYLHDEFFMLIKDIVVYSEDNSDYNLPSIKASVNVSGPHYRKGDLNKNGRIDLQDIIILLKLYLGSIAMDDFNSIIGDLDDNGNIGLSDIIALLKTYLNGN